MWFLARNPQKSVILASHSAHLATDFSRNVRDAVAYNPRFTQLFPGVRVHDTFATQADWALTTAYRSSFRAVGVGTGVTGRGGDLLVLDDPVADDSAAFSKAQRDAAWTWYQQTFRDRLEPRGAIVLIMSRWHEDDLAGRLMRASKDGSGETWESLHLPALGTDGAALWPERYPVTELESLRRAVGSRAWNARFMGSPRPDEGTMLNSAGLIMVDRDAVPPMSSVVRRWDLAFSEQRGSDFVAGAKVGRTNDGRFVILDMQRFRGHWNVSKPRIIETALNDGPTVRCLIESNGPQRGYYDDVRSDRRMFGTPVGEDRPEGSKTMRAQLWGSRLQDGVILCVRGAWNGELCDEMDAFPNGEHDDQVDAISGAYNALATQGQLLCA